MHKLIKNLVLSVVLLLLASSLALGATQEKFDNGVVDWENSVIRVTGYGAPPVDSPEAAAQLMAVRGAKVDAMRNALEIVEKVRVSSATTMEKYIVTSDVVKTNVQSFMNAGFFEEPVFDPKGSCSIVMNLPLTGHEGLLTMMYNTVKPSLAAPSQPASIPSVAIEPVGKPYTGIVIDARSVGVKPALYPQIFDVDGLLLYGPTMVNTQQVDFTTMVGYSRSIEKAVSMPRVGDNPLKLTAISSVKASNGETTDVVLNSEATRAFRSAVSQTDIIAKSAVVIIIN